MATRSMASSNDAMELTPTLSAHATRWASAKSTRSTGQLLERDEAGVGWFEAACVEVEGSEIVIEVDVQPLASRCS